MIRTAIVGVGNCASSLVQGVHYCRTKGTAMAMSAIRCARIALDRKLAGAICEASAYLFKHPPRKVQDDEGYRMLLDFAAGDL